MSVVTRAGMVRTLLVVNAEFPQPPSAQHGPRKDYVALAEALQATVIDRPSVRCSLSARLIARLFGTPTAQAWLAFLRHRAYDAILTDGEHVGIPLALLLKFARARVAHVTIGHRITAAKKAPFFRWLKVQGKISRIAVHSRLQRELAVERLGLPPERVALVPYQVDAAFWQPQSVPEERLICSAGLEFRDYPTLFQAVDGLDARVVIGAASHWSRRGNRAAGMERPANVEVGSFDYHALRDLYARAAVVVVPLDDVDFQAGVTTILEAMAMGKVVVVTHSRGQTDVVEDRRSVTRGAQPRPRPISLVRELAADAGLTLAPNGLYVPPNDPAALRVAITYLLDHPERRRELGAAGRRAIEQLLTVEHFAERLRDLVHGAAAAVRSGQSGPRPRPAPAAVSPSRVG